MTQAVFETAKTIEAWDEDYYPPIAERFYDRAVARMLRLLGVGPEEMVVDAGCGPGVHSVRAARAGFSVYAIDLSQAMLGEARKRAISAGVADKIKFEQADLTSLAFADSTSKRVFSWGVIIHIPDLEKAIDELARIVQPGGRLALYLTNKHAWDHGIERIARKILRRPGPALERRPLGDGFWCDMAGEKLWVWRIDIPAVSRLLESKGFSRKARIGGEFSEFQRRVKGPFRNMLLRLNNLCFAIRFPARACCANLIVFEKNS